MPPPNLATTSVFIGTFSFLIPLGIWKGKEKIFSVLSLMLDVVRKKKKAPVVILVFISF